MKTECGTLPELGRIRGHDPHPVRPHPHRRHLVCACPPEAIQTEYIEWAMEALPSCADDDPDGERSIKMKLWYVCEALARQKLGLSDEYTLFAADVQFVDGGAVGVHVRPAPIRRESVIDSIWLSYSNQKLSQ